MPPWTICSTTSSACCGRRRLPSAAPNPLARARADTSQDRRPEPRPPSGGSSSLYTQATTRGRPRRKRAVGTGSPVSGSARRPTTRGGHDTGCHFGLRSGCSREATTRGLELLVGGSVSRFDPMHPFAGVLGRFERANSSRRFTRHPEAPPRIEITLRRQYSLGTAIASRRFSDCALRHGGLDNSLIGRWRKGWRARPLIGSTRPFSRARSRKPLCVVKADRGFESLPLRSGGRKAAWLRG